MWSTNVMVEEARCEELEKVIIGEDEGKFFQVRVQLPPWEKEELIGFLMRNIDVFAWSAYEAPRVDLNFICHHITSIPLSSRKSNHLSAHLRNILMLSKKRWLSLNEPGP